VGEWLLEKRIETGALEKDEAVYFIKKIFTEVCFE